MLELYHASWLFTMNLVVVQLVTTVGQFTSTIQIFQEPTKKTYFPYMRTFKLAVINK
jgi:uncharacterized metal-binding protein